MLIKEHRNSRHRSTEQCKESLLRITKEYKQAPSFRFLARLSKLEEGSGWQFERVICISAADDTRAQLPRQKAARLTKRRRSLFALISSLLSAPILAVFEPCEFPPKRGNGETTGVIPA